MASAPDFMNRLDGILCFSVHPNSVRACNQSEVFLQRSNSRNAKPSVVVLHFVERARLRIVTLSLQSSRPVATIVIIIDNTGHIHSSSCRYTNRHQGDAS